MTIKIYKPSRTSMQSGTGKTKKWIAEYISDSDSSRDYLMGWTSSFDTQTQIKLFFDTLDQAIDWVKKTNYQYFVELPRNKKIKIKSYSSNFDTDRKEPWTH